MTETLLPVEPRVGDRYRTCPDCGERQVVDYLPPADAETPGPGSATCEGCGRPDYVWLPSGGQS